MTVQISGDQQICSAGYRWVESGGIRVLQPLGEEFWTVGFGSPDIQPAFLDLANVMLGSKLSTLTFEEFLGRYGPLWSDETTDLRTQAESERLGRVFNYLGRQDTVERFDKDEKIIRVLMDGAPAIDPDLVLSQLVYPELKCSRVAPTAEGLIVHCDHLIDAMWWHMALAFHIPRPYTFCAICGRPLMHTGTRPKSTCSNKCRLKLSRDRKKIAVALLNQGQSSATFIGEILGVSAEWVEDLAESAHGGPAEYGYDCYAVRRASNSGMSGGIAAESFVDLVNATKAARAKD